MSDAPPIVPLISTSVAGPSGIMHLPRLWLKLLLHAKGRLAEGYRFGEGGFDERLCDQIGLDRDAFIAYIGANEPDYPTTERYVLEHAKNATPEAIAQFNAHVISASFSDKARAAALRERFGILGDDFANVIALNDLDDWAGVHEALAHS